jgi:hypothetical protein
MLEIRQAGFMMNGALYKFASYLCYTWRRGIIFNCTLVANSYSSHTNLLFGLLLLLVLADLNMYISIQELVKQNI